MAATTKEELIRMLLTEPDMKISFEEAHIMILDHTSMSLKTLAEHFEKFVNEYSVEEFIAYLREVSDEQNAQMQTLELFRQLNIEAN